MSSFGPVAPFYDQLMSSVPYTMWVSYYQLLLAHQDIYPKRLLDVACGTGIMSELLLAEGYDVTGIDLSPSMIEQARAKAIAKQLPLRFEVANAASFDLGETFDAAYSFFDSLNYITDPDDLQACFHRVAAHLPSGGSWIFDLNTRYAFEQEMFDQQNLKASSPVRYDWHGDWDPHRLIIRVDMKFWFEGQEYTETHLQRAHPHEDVLEMLAEAGFEKVRCFHSYTLNPPRRASDRLHYTAIKR